ncbi:MAG: DUF1566 domain-containing protein [Pseudomonadota bacterium]
MKGISLILAILVLGCGPDNGGTDDAAADQPADSSDTAADPGSDDAAVEVECFSNADCDDENPCTVDICNPARGACTHAAIDADGDGHYAGSVDGFECADGTDCDDGNEGVHPGADPDCTGLVDMDCDGLDDPDEDGDGHITVACSGGDDCDDEDPDSFLGECEGVSECCDGCRQMNGCWRDPTTGYLWQDPPMTDGLAWDAAISYCAGLSLAGHDEWKLPTISELRTLIRGCAATEDGGPCGATDACLESACSHDCDECEDGGGPGARGCYWDKALEGYCGPAWWYWSSSTYETEGTFIPGFAWIVDFGNAEVLGGGKDGDMPVRCVLPEP